MTSHDPVHSVQRVGDDPALSVVMITRDRFARLLPALRRLAGDPDAGEVELVVVVSSAATAAVDPEELEAFASYRVVEHAPMLVTGAALACGFRAASAPVVAVLEDHVFVRAGWISSLISVHEGPWGSVGHMMTNANPGSAISWAELLIDFGPVVSPVAPGPGPGPGRLLGWHQTSYKRELVLARGERLASLLETEGLLHAELTDEGHPTYLADVEIAHVNFERLGALLCAELIGGRLFAANRAHHTAMSSLQRLIRVLAAPLVCARRSRQFVRDFLRVRTVRPVPTTALAYGSVALVAHATGELLGYLLGVGDAAERKAEYELDRTRYVAPGTIEPPPRAPAPGSFAPTSGSPR